jgi:crossover junction endodeoxyribonuclease RusA
VASLDDDNMVKPIRDAINKLVYVDDSQICYSETIHFSIDAAIKVRGASTILLTAFSKGDEFLYIRIDDAPDVIQLPR